MLKQEADLKYIVYPSWAEGGYAYAWRDLPVILADPLRAGHQDIADAISKYGELCHPPVRLVDGPCGGGIIIEGPAPVEASNMVLWHKVANVRVPDDMRLLGTTFRTHVAMIEPFDGFAGLVQTGKRANNFPVRASVDHAEAAGNKVFWLFNFRDSPKSLTCLEELPRLVSAFGLTAAIVTDLPTDLEKETAAWYENATGNRIWYEIGATDDRVGYQFATLLYIAAYLKKKISFLQWAHLVAQVEGKPSPRILWNKRQREISSQIKQ